ncbi:T9SS type A sorting domain-containing protein [Parabacteroides sp. FAFU027]|uniref:T9SS type A sorting domain-containing protein n=1 Tax=Parabacteroides sp. FAFU027 TaxID=2922715 RepID=UPI001FAE97F3|nr:T9SS type A sorting domain-containing protein [Parabacteroides sp. FAFU027]
MKQFYLLLSCLVLIMNLSAQPYKAVYSKRTCLYLAKHHDPNAYLAEYEQGYTSLRFDSTKVINCDSVFFPHPVIQYNGGQCYSPEWSWIGKKVIVRPDETVFFINCDGDTIRLKAQAGLKESWTAYQQNLTTVIAEVTALDQRVFLGLKDSVKTISFKVYDATMKPTPHMLDTLTILLSKHYGIIQSLNFYNFPNRFLSTYSLEGMDNPQVGVQNLTWKDVWDFQPGDELHITTENYAGIPSPIRLFSKTIDKYLARTQIADTIIYTIDRTESFCIDSVGEKTTQITHGIITDKIYPNLQFDFLSKENNSSYPKNEFNCMIQSDSNSKQSNAVPLVNLQSCWNEIMADGCFAAKNYQRGLGGPYFYCDGFDAFSIARRDLVYYKKGSTEWGNKLIITGVTTPVQENPISVNINENKQLTVKVAPEQLPCILELISLAGTAVQKSKLGNIVNELNLQNLSTGIYLYRITSSGRNAACGKVVLK